MVVNVYSYGTVALVHDRIGWVIPARAVFSASTIPSESEVEVTLDSVANEIHAALLENGYPAELKTTITTNAPRAVGWLERLNVAGACAEILQMFPVANDEESGNSPEKVWRKIYENGLKLIRGAFLARMGLSRSYALSELLVSTATLDTDDNEKLPFFKKRMWEVPGTNADVSED